MTQSCVIVGGGLAGLAAAVRLAEQGVAVTLVEARSFCGGRTYSYAAPVVGEIVDNGQHLLLGCYTATQDYLRCIGSHEQLLTQSRLEIPFRSDATHMATLRCPNLPAPLHLLTGLARLQGFSLADVWALVRHRHDLMRDPLPRYVDWDQLSCADWLARAKFSASAIQKFWEPLILAVMNDAPTVVSAAPFLKALQRIATGNAQAAALSWSRVGLSDLFVTPALRQIAQRGAQILTGTTVAKVTVSEGRVESVTTRTGEVLTADHFIFATPPKALVTILEATPGTMVLREMLGCWRSSPIVSVYLWYDRPVMSQPLVGLWGSPFHWVFCRNAIVPSAAPVHGVTLIISGAREFERMEREDVVAKAIATMQQYFPESRNAQLLHRLVSREPAATVCLAPGTQRLRAALHSPWVNAQFAGDWTDTHLPATIEGAIVSGVAATVFGMRHGQQ